MFNESKSPSLFYFIFILLFFFGACRSSKKISSSNPSYINIDYDNISYYVEWKTDFQSEKIFLNKDEKPSTEKLLPLYIKAKSARSMKVNNKKESVALFLLDTLNTNINNRHTYIENPLYFGELFPVEAHYHRTKKDHMLGEYKEELLNTDFSFRDIAFALIQFGIISTYDHLFAEMVIMKELDTADVHEIHYNCVYHICTSKCFDPKYKFFIRFNKKTRSISIGKI